MTAEELDNMADEVGTALLKVEWDLRQLFGVLNFEDLNDEQVSDLHRLGQVRDLVEIAASLFPYPYGDERDPGNFPPLVAA